MTMREAIQIDRYIENGGDACPYCGSNDIEAGVREYAGKYMYQEITCNACGKFWDATFKLVSIIERENEAGQY